MFNPDKKIYRKGAEKMYRKEGVKESIEGAVQKLYEDPELFTPPKLREFFGLGKNTVLTDEETTTFKRYASYAGKRLLFASMTVYGDSSKSLKQVEKKLKEHREKLSKLPLHDIAHTIASYGEHTGESNSVVPAFLDREKLSDYSVPMKEEFFALMWWTPAGKDPIFLALADPERFEPWRRAFQKRIDESPTTVRDIFQKDFDSAIASLNPQQFESVLEAYYGVVLSILKVIDIQEKIGLDLEPASIPSLASHLDERAQPMKEHKEERTVELARDVFERYKEDPKILFHKFEEICAPLLERLNRKESQLQ